MSPVDYVNSNFRITAYSHALRREQFAFGEATYDGWFLLALELGTFRYTIGNETGIASVGDLIICPPGLRFCRQALGVLSFHMFEFEWTTTAGLPVLASEIHLCGKKSLQHLDRFASTLDLLSKLEIHPGSDSRVWQESMLRDLVLLVLLEDHLSPYKEDSRDRPFIAQAMKLLQRHAFDNTGLAAVASQLGLSLSHFSVKYKQLTGSSPSQYVTALRMQKAKMLLIDTQEPLECIAPQCGYQNGFYLSRVFQQFYQTSPSEYRRRNRV
ncbi:hypothetical protein SY83_07060 [Paenibacillus swuensis]|uniref:HTH araC/xylS-type domain-containing protein n=1 Tax=Paenibacillus swuensis TaxID=1178515 RepID=A0A172TGB1_9BACL|nr:AraC family transcriptional regulator [Paenibacillus swuensis]ANE46081.1 hypothetical protein SY83_07060 [Paenibacillus swuensis]